MLHLIKIILVLFSLYFAYLQKEKNKDISLYWIIVALYWGVNFMQGFIK